MVTSGENFNDGRSPVHFKIIAIYATPVTMSVTLPATMHGQSPKEGHILVQSKFGSIIIHCVVVK